MPPALEILSLDTATPQIRAPGTGDTYTAPRGVEITPEAGSKALTLTGGTQTTSQPVIDATQTWNAGGVTFTGIKYNVTDTASAAGSLLMDLQVGGVSQFRVAKGGGLTLAGGITLGGNISGAAAPATLSISGGDSIGLTSQGSTRAWVTPGYTGVPGGILLNTANNSGLSWGAGVFSTIDLVLTRDAAQTLAQRNSTNAQTFRIYNTFTDASNYERGKIAWSSNVLQIGTEKAGTGTARALELQTDGTTRLTISAAGGGTYTGQFNLTNTRATTGINIVSSISVGASQPLYLQGYRDSSDRTWVGFAGGFDPSASNVAIDNNGALLLAGNNSLNWTNATNITFGATVDLTLVRDAGNVLAQRRSTNAQESRIYGSYTSATNFQRLSVKTLRESSGALSGASYTTTIAIPAYAHLVGVTTRVTTAITGATTYDVGDGTDVDLWGAAIGIAEGSQSRTADFTAVAAVGPAAASRTVTLTANGSNFTGGVVEICLHYLTTEAD